MTGIARRIVLAALAVLMTAASGHGADIDRTAVDFTIPSDTTWLPER